MSCRGLGSIDEIANLLFRKRAAIVLCQQRQIGRLLLQRSSHRTVTRTAHPVTLRAIAAEVELRAGDDTARPHFGLRICSSFSKPNERAAQHQNGRQSPETTM